MNAELLKKAVGLQGLIDDLETEINSMRNIRDRNSYMYPQQVKIAYLGEEGYNRVVNLMLEIMTDRRKQAQAEFDAL